MNQKIANVGTILKKQAKVREMLYAEAKQQTPSIQRTEYLVFAV
jgi:hypothetical protein